MLQKLRYIPASIVVVLLCNAVFHVRITMRDVLPCCVNTYCVYNSCSISILPALHTHTTHAPTHTLITISLHFKSYMSLRKGQRQITHNRTGTSSKQNLPVPGMHPNSHLIRSSLETRGDSHPPTVNSQGILRNVTYKEK